MCAKPSNMSQVYQLLRYLPRKGELEDTVNDAVYQRWFSLSGDITENFLLSGYFLKEKDAPSHLH